VAGTPEPPPKEKKTLDEWGVKEVGRSSKGSFAQDSGF
jgi:hypothetical protein